MPGILLRLEGLAVAVAAVLFYISRGGGWLLFVLLILAPDLSMLGYLAGPRPGSVIYNAIHTYLAPAVLAALGLLLGQPLILNIALIWLVHIGADRLFGFGLKYPTEFKDTHFGRV
jgi:hypothetical protein